MRIAVLVFVVLAGLAVVVMVPFMRMGLFVGVRMRVTVAMSMIMSSMAVVPEASHAAKFTARPKPLTTNNSINRFVSRPSASRSVASIIISILINLRRVSGVQIGGTQVLH